MGPSEWRLRRAAFWILILPAGGFAAILLAAVLVYPPQYVLRLLLWGDADVEDYRRFPERRLETRPPAFRFADALDGSPVRELFEADPRVDDLDEFLARNHTQAFIVIRDDAVLYEGYFNGSRRDSIVTSFSMAKSFVSALVGIAIAEGHIGGVEDPITTYLPELAERDPAFRGITIRNLLMMSSGIRYVEFPFLNGDDAKTYYFPDLRSLALEQTRIVEGPGQRFHYNNYHPLLLGMILERSTGTSVAGYLQEKIWKPLGMEFAGSWSLDSEESRFEKLESGINARAIDFAKLGRLYLEDGSWRGKQVVPASWVAESTSVDPSLDRAEYYGDGLGRTVWTGGRGYYKYMWYGQRRDGGEYDFIAEGNRGQIIYVSPHKKLIIVRNGRAYGIPQREWVELFYGFATALQG
jgi:CubicO group peptidase (beta-lactamase class C family)